MTHAHSPFTTTLAKINDYSEYFKLHLGVPEQPDWRRARDIVSNETWFVAHLTAMHEMQPYMPRHVLATNFYDHYEWYLITSGMAAFLMDQRVPYLDTGNIALRFDEMGWVRGIALAGDVFACLPTDEAADTPGVFVLEDREALRRHFAGQVWAHMRRLIPLIQAYVPTAEHSLRLATANSLASSALWMLQRMQQGDIAEHESRAMAAALPYPTHPRYFEVECNGEREVHLDGSVCCYWHKRPGNESGEYCGNCPIVPIPQRIETLRRHMQARQQGVRED